MDIKRIWDFLIVAGLAFGTSWLINHYFFDSKKGQLEKNGTVGFVAPEYEEESKPLNTEVDFVDGIKYYAPKVLTDVETDLASLVFSTEGACLEQYELKPILGTTEISIETIFPPASNNQENRCFLIGCDGKTPFSYQLVEKRDLECTVEIEYRAPYNGGFIKKVFTVHKNSYQIDLDIAYESNNQNNPVALRIFYPSPLMPDLEANDAISSIVGDEKDYIRKTARGSLSINQGWLFPTLFGSDSRYMIHAMIKDHNSFCQRAYYKFYDKQRIMSILEGPATKDSASWNVSFYMGPKAVSAMQMVDPRLEQTLDYSGWFAPFAKFMLAILKFLYGYVHNYGFAIIILTLLIRLLLMPFTMRGEELMKRQSEVGKKLEYIKQRYKDDPERLEYEQRELMKKYGMPGIAGCLPLLIQIPIFYGLARILSCSIELYKAPFLWITDLSARDPWYLIPILVMVASVLTSVRAPANYRGTQGVSSFLMPMVFGVFAFFVSAGLALYFLVSTALGVVQVQLARKWFKQ